MRLPSFAMLTCRLVPLCVCRRDHPCSLPSTRPLLAPLASPPPRYKVFINVAEGSSHQVRVRAINALGVPGAWSSYFSCATDPAVKPSTPVAPTRGSLAGADSDITVIPLQMTPPSSIGAEITAYRVSVSGRTPVTTSSTYYAVRGLTPSTSYTISFEAYNSKGWSDPSPTVTFTTSAAIAPLVPTNFLSLDLPSGYYASTSIYLGWNLGNNVDNHAKTGSPVSSYVVEYCPTSAPSSCTTVTKTSASALVGSLSYSTAYQFRAKSESSTTGLSSAWSGFTTFSTAAGEVPTAPPAGPWQTLPSFLNNATGIYVGWSPADGKGMQILQYRIEINGGGWTYLGTATAYWHRDLLPNTDITYRVAARNQVGWGPATTVQTLSTAAGKPPQVPYGIRLDNGDPSVDNVTIMSLAWTAPSSDVAITQYHVHLTYNGNNGNEARDMVSTRAFLKVEFLPPGVTALVKVRAQSSVGLSPWSPAVSLTAEPPKAPRAPHSLRQGGPASGAAPATQATVQWDHDHFLDRYGLQTEAIRINQNEGTPNAQVLEKSCIGIFCGNSYSIMQLDPLSVHTVTVQIQTSLGWSPKSEPVTLNVPDATPPLAVSPVYQAPPMSTHPSSVHVVLGWVTGQYTGLPLVKYNIFIDEGLPNARTETLTCPCGTTFPLYDLSPGQTHTFALQGYNSKGWGAKSATASLTTTAGAAPWSPRDFDRGPNPHRVSDVNSFHLSWTPPMDDGIPRTKYELEVTDPSGAVTLLDLAHELPSYTYRCYNGADHASRTIGECMPQTTYTFRLRAVNTIGNGAWSISRTLTTSARRPPKRMVTPVMARNLNDYWRDPVMLGTWWREADDDGSLIDNYELCFEVVDENGTPTGTGSALSDLTSCTGSSCCFELGRPDQSYDAYVVSSGLDYAQIHYRHVKIRAHNVAGWAAEYSPVALLSTKMPTAPVKMPALHNAQHLLINSNAYSLCRNIAVEWEYGRSAGLRSHNYTIRVNFDDSTIVTVPTNRRAAWLGPFDYGSVHQVQIRSANVLGYGPWSDATECATRPIAIAPKINPPIKKLLVGIDPSISIPIAWSGRDLCDTANAAELLVDGELMNLPHSTGCGSVNYYIHTGLTPGSNHTYSARIKNVLGWGNWSDTAVLSTVSTVPAEPPSASTQSLNASTAVLTLTVPYHNGLPIDQLRLQVGAPL